MAPQRWEYRLEVIDLAGSRDPAAARDDATNTLGALGEAGWEAVGFSPSHASGHGLRVETTQYVVLLKRPLGD